MFAIDLTDRVAWITGGSRGIGRAVALAFAKAGCNVAVGYHSREEQAQEVIREVIALGRQGIHVQMNVADAASALKAHEKVKSSLGPVDILVNSAGVISDNLFLALEEEDWRKVLDTNVMGVVNVTKIAVRDMMMKRRGRIINLSSIAGMKSGKGQANYAASKGAVEALTRSIATELGSRGITANCVAPGVIETDMSEEVIKLGRDEILARQVVKRFGKPEEIAAWILFLASDFGEFITGQVIPIDGGMKMV